MTRTEDINCINVNVRDSLIKMSPENMQIWWANTQYYLQKNDGIHEASLKNHINHCYENLKWELPFTEQLLKLAKQRRIIREENGFLRLI